MSESPKKETVSPELPKYGTSLPKKEITSSARTDCETPTNIKKVTSPPLNKNVSSLPSKKENNSHTLKKNNNLQQFKAGSPPMSNEVETQSIKLKEPSPPRKEIITSPLAFKINKIDSKLEHNSLPQKTVKKDSTTAKDISIATEKISVTTIDNTIDKMNSQNNEIDTTTIPSKVDLENKNDGKLEKTEESNGVGDKIRKFEKVAEDASVNVGRLSRPGSVRGRSRTERLGSDSKEEFPPPATPFKDNVFFELSTHSDKAIPNDHGNCATLERQQSISKNSTNIAKWQRSESNSIEGEKPIHKPQPQKIIKPEFKPMPSPVDITIRSPSLGAKIGDQFPSHGTAFRNVASPDPARPRDVQKLNEDVNTQNNLKTCKFKNKERYSVSKGSSYFTRGSEEIWLVKKKDIEEIEERVLDSFRRAGGNLCMRSESARPSSDSGQNVSFSHATMGRKQRQMYTRSESLDPQWAGTRATTLKRQSSVACTCGHDKKTRAKSAGAETAPRPRSRSHGDENNQCHVLDKYETLV